MPEHLHLLDVSDPDRWATRSADVIEAAIVAAVDRNGQCHLAISGGSTPQAVLIELAGRDLPWESVTWWQVDERIVAADSGERNLVAQREALGATGARCIPLPVDDLLTLDWESGTARAVVHDSLENFVATMGRELGTPPVFDLIHLGLGVDGHTASLFPGDPLSDELRAFVGVAEPPGLARRLSLTRAALDRARMVVWLVSGSEKASMLQQLLAGEQAIPAGRVRPAHFGCARPTLRRHRRFPDGSSGSGET